MTLIGDTIPRGSRNPDSMDYLLTGICDEPHAAAHFKFKYNVCCKQTFIQYFFVGQDG